VPVASYMDTEILCLMRLIGMRIPDKHIRRDSDDLLEGPLRLKFFIRSLCLGSHVASRLLQINIPSRKDKQLIIISNYPKQSVSCLAPPSFFFSVS
jgi:hypothetical protein